MQTSRQEVAVYRPLPVAVTGLPVGRARREDRADAPGDEEAATALLAATAPPAPARPALPWLTPAASRARALPREAIAVVLVSLALHAFIGSAMARTGGAGKPFVRPPSRTKVTVARRLEPPKPPIVPQQAPEQAPEPPKPRRPLPRKLIAAPPPPVPVAAPEPPREAPPVLATTAAVEPGAVIGSAEGSLHGVPGGRIVEAPPPPPPPPPVIAAHEGANYLKNPRPAYPELAQRRGWHGNVLLRVRVGGSGRPEAIAVKRSSGREVLDQAAVETVRGWTFVPARQGGAPVAGWVEVPVVFKLEQE